MNISESPYGQLPTGQFVSLFTLTNSRGSRARVINYGGILQSLEVPDRSGALADVVLGKDRLEDYLAGHPHFGAITGRVAGRIRGGSFQSGWGDLPARAKQFDELSPRRKRRFRQATLVGQDDRSRWAS